MSATELKQKITNQLLKIDDVDFLNGMVNLLENNTPTHFYELNMYQEKRIEEVRNEFAKGNILSDNQVQNNVAKWLQSK